MLQPVWYSMRSLQSRGRRRMSKELQEALDKAALAVQPILDEMLKEIEEDGL